MKRTEFVFEKNPENPLILGPMAGVTSRPFRLLCHENGTGLVSMEMVSANAIKYGNRATEKLMVTDEAEHPVSLQLFGPDPETIALAAAYAEKRFAFDVLDINMGCPMPKIVNNGEGAALMRDPVLCGEIVRAVKAVIDKPVTVKMRLGMDEAHRNAVEVALACEAAGASAIAVHGRTREQYYTGDADWDGIQKVAEAVSVPVIGSGDVTCPLDAERMLLETGVSYVMIARAARGNPWIFGQCLAYLAEKGFAAAPNGAWAERWLPDRIDPKIAQRPPVEILCDTMLRHAAMMVEEKGEKTGILEMRSHIAFYATGYPKAAAFRRRVNGVSSFSELTDAVCEWRKITEMSPEFL